MAKHGTDWTKEQLKLLHDHYADTLTADLVAIIGRDECSIYHKAYKLGLKKSPEFLASPLSGRLQTSPIGTEYFHHSGYLIRKVEKDWKPVHIIVWEEHHGPVPEGYMVTFKDGIRYPVDINSLELITRQALLDRNTIHRYPKEMIGVFRLQEAFKRTIERREKDAA